MFAWSHEDMPKIDPTIVVHRLNFNHSRCSIKHKRRAINSKKNKIAVKERSGEASTSKFDPRVEVPKVVVQCVID